MNNAEASFDPLVFPSYTPKSLETNFAALICGLAVYEASVCLQVYRYVFSVNRLKSPIFMLVTISVFSLVIGTIVHVMIAFSANNYDVFFSKGENEANTVDVALTIIGKISYYTAGTLRSRALLVNKFPKVLWFIYFMLFASVVLNASIFALLTSWFSYWTFTPPQLFDPAFPFIPAYNAFLIVRPVCQAFDTVLANVLIITFLSPIFINLDMKFVPAVKVMAALGDVQKAIWASVLTIIFLYFNLAVDTPSIATAVLNLWLHTQNSQFLRLSYVSTAELFSMYSKGVSTRKPTASVVASRPVTSSNGNHNNV